MQFCRPNSLLCKRKSPPHPWKQKWESEGNIETSDWVTVWENVHHPSMSQKVQSSAWELLHRNYMCAYFAKIIFQGTGICKLCRVEQKERIHIFVHCSVLDDCYNSFLPLLNNIFPVGNLTIKEKIWGIKIEKNNHGKDVLRNYITSIIKHIVYRNRNFNFGHIDNAAETVVNKVKNYIKEDLRMKHKIASQTHRLESFNKMYLIGNLLGHLNEENKLTITEL